MARLTREQQKQATRDALLSAARELFTAKSYGAVSAEAIARAAGVTRATFYLHFRSKAETVVDLMRGIEPEIADAYRALDAVAEPTPEAVREWLAGHVELWRRYRMEFAAMEQAMADDRLVADEWFRLLRSVPRLMTRTLDARPEGEAREFTRIRLTTLMMGVDRALHFLVVRGHDEDGDRVLWALAEQWSAVLGRE